VASQILIAEDEPSVRALLLAVLNDAGFYEIAFATNGQEALDIARAQLPAMAFLDIRMPGPDGYEVCQSLKADPLTANIHITLLSGLSQTPDVQLALRAKADDYIVKPFSPLQIVHKVRKTLSGHVFKPGDRVRVDDRIDGTILRSVQLRGHQPGREAYHVREDNGVLEEVAPYRLSLIP
jgi:CheY-like chemotaxis protein